MDSYKSLPYLISVYVGEGAFDVGSTSLIIKKNLYAGVSDESSPNRFDFLLRKGDGDLNGFEVIIVTDRGSACVVRYRSTWQNPFGKA